MENRLMDEYRPVIDRLLTHSARAVLLVALLASCTATKPPAMSEGHLEAPAAEPPSAIPAPVLNSPGLMPPRPQPRPETYTVVVNGVPAQELLFSLARDANLNVDIHPDIEGLVSINAINQTLPQILDRIAKQVSLRYQLDGTTLVLEPDAPYWKNYVVDYVNMARDTTSEVGVATQISTAGGGVGDSSSSSSSSRGNISNTKVKNKASHHFWEVLEKNILAILGGDHGTHEGHSPVVVNALSGMISVHASHAKQREVQAFVDQALSSALRQVLIEMTIVEVDLSDRYQAGVDWQSLASGDGFSILSSMTGSNLATPPVLSLGYQNTTSSGRNVSTTLRMLESFGDVKVLSSPKIMALNNQTALLKVVDEKVYFTVDMETIIGDVGKPDRFIYTSEIHTVPVGLVMSVTPQINSVDSITLSIRPTISRITGYAVDPAPRLANSGFDNLIPEIQVREMESLLQIVNGQMVVMGGLMQNKVDKTTEGVPLLSDLPWVGPLFRYKDDIHRKSELVIFLRPTVVKGTSAEADLSAYSHLLPEPTPGEAL